MTHNTQQRVFGWFDLASSQPAKLRDIPPSSDVSAFPVPPADRILRPPGALPPQRYSDVC
ncbi:MAG: hypothetical protein IT440_13310, partial [Phycisphaeraceae bacterium]|nr:hypothetical protein [Phycisphaeraceae bacterium]